jgi:hypothetical protein
MNRRKFINSSSLTMMGLSLFIKDIYDLINTQVESDDIRAYLRRILYSKQDIDEWFEGKSYLSTKYNSELGWLLNNGSFQDGINKSWTVYTYEGEEGGRIMTNYRDKKCRINTYGDSFTQCGQVSDNETWQEVLAAHLQEPLRNFGVGGWSVYQAYLRMIKEEKHTPSNFIIFNIFEDDHLRNLDSWRNIRVPKHPIHIESTLPFLKVDMEKDKILENKNPCPTRESFYKLCDIDETYKLFKDDFVLKIMIAHEKSKQNNPKKYFDSLMQLSKTQGIETRIDENSTLSEAADKLHKQVAVFSTQKIVERIEDYAKLNNKKVLFVLSFSPVFLAKYLMEGYRWEPQFIDFLKMKNLPFIDLSQAHLNDFKKFNISVEEYLNRYFVGHYNPMGNFFCAHTIRDKVVEMLDPKPIAYKPRN